MLTTIANYLTALLELFKEKHLSAKDYQEHLLFERLAEGISGQIDELKELAIATGEPTNKVASAIESLESAMEILEETSDPLELEKETVEAINKAIKSQNNIYSQAVISLLTDISKTRTRDIYLLSFRRTNK